MITVYGRATSSNVQVVMWGIGELGLEYERLDYGHVYGGLDTPEYRAMNPHGLVPTIRDGALVMWESSAILRYLAARYGAAPFWPEDPAARAPVDMWAEWARTTLVRDFARPIFWVCIGAPDQRDETTLAVAVTRFEGHLATLQDRIGAGPWLLGADFTVADILCGHLLYRYFTLDIVRGELAGIAAYYARLQDRPAFAEHVMVSYDPLRAGTA